MTPGLDPDDLDFSSLVRPGDGVLWGQASAEPVTLTRQLLAQRSSIGAFSVFLGIPASDTVKPEHTDLIRFSSYCGAGINRQLADMSKLDIVPCHYSQFPALIRSGKIRVDVLLLQVAPPDSEGNCSYSIAQEYLVAAAQTARVIIAEVNDQAPVTPCQQSINVRDIHHLVYTSRPVLETPPPRIGDSERLIAAHVAGLINDGDTLQLGIGSLPEAILGALGNHRDLGIHSGTIGDKVAELMQNGVINNRHKTFDPGLTVAGIMMGTRKLYDFAHHNRTIRLMPSSYTHDIGILSGQHNLVAINAALEVDLTGQVNAEEAGGHYLGAVGGALDFVRGASRAPGGRAIMALPSTARGHSRIVARLNGPVSTPRSDVGFVVTEQGVADLRGLSLSQRIERMIAIAHPDFRDTLAKEATAIAGSYS